MMPKIEHSPESTLKATQIIASGLMAGVVSTVGMVSFLVTNEVVGIHVQGNTISLVMAALTAMTLLLLAVLWNLPVKSTADRPVYTIWQQRMVLRFAFLEGGALFNAVACIVEREWWSFALLLGVLTLMILLFPTRKRFDRFLETHAPLP